MFSRLCACSVELLCEVFYRPLQVNGQDVTNDGYEGVVAKIKAMPNEAHLLVADAETYEQFKRSEQHPELETTQIFIEVIACPDEPIDTSRCNCYIVIVTNISVIIAIHCRGIYTMSLVT